MNSQRIANGTGVKDLGQTTSAGTPVNSPKTKPAIANNGRNKFVSADKSASASSSPATGVLPRNEPKEISFHLDAPSAHEVLLAGEFTDWEKAPIKMIKGGGGVWHVKKLLAPGRHLYRFLVDGGWHNDPNCTEHVPNPFGTTNSVLEIS